jgi:hypothetical protein
MSEVNAKLSKKTGLFYAAERSVIVKHNTIFFLTSLPSTNLKMYETAAKRKNITNIQ